MVLEAIAQKVLGKYFSAFLKNFRKEDLTLKVLSGEAAIENIGILIFWNLISELNTDVLQDILNGAAPHLGVKKALVSKISLKVGTHFPN